MIVASVELLHLGMKADRARAVDSSRHDAAKLYRRWDAKTV